MYTVVVTEHFEDWYVDEATIAEFETLDDAILCYCAECGQIVSGGYRATGIDQYVSESLGSDEEVTEDASVGVVAEVRSDDEQIVSLHFDYDHRSRSIGGCSELELDLESLTQEQVQLIRRFIR